MRKTILTKGGTLRRTGFVAVLGLALLVSACSDNKEQPATAVSSKEVSQQSPGQQPAGSQTAATPAATSQNAPPAGGGGACAQMLTAKCSECHALTRICEKLGKKSKARWQRTIDRMIERGSKLAPEESATILVCLDKGATNDLQEACR